MNFVFSINWNCNAKYFLVLAFFELNEKKNFVILIIVSKKKKENELQSKMTHIFFKSVLRLFHLLKIFYLAKTFIFNLSLGTLIYTMVSQFAINIQMHPNCLATNIWSQTITPYAEMCIFHTYQNYKTFLKQLHSITFKLLILNVIRIFYKKNCKNQMQPSNNQTFKDVFMPLA